MEQYIPTKMLKEGHRKKPWVDCTVRAAIRKKNKLFSRKKRTKKDSDIAKYKQSKQHTQKLTRQAHYSYVNNLLEADNPDSDFPPKQKRFWSYI